MLYIVNCEVIKSYYMGNDEIETITHIVEADSEHEVEIKVRKYYKTKDDPYYLTHIVNINYSNESIT